MKKVERPAVKKAKAVKAVKDEIITGSGNVFADLGLPHAELDMLKVNIAMAISATMEKRKLTQAQAAKIIGTDQGKMSNLTRGVLKGFTVDRLLAFLICLGRDVEITLPKMHKTSTGRIRVRNAA